MLPFGLLDFDLVMNHGAVFGIGQEQRTVFIIFTLTAVTLALVIFAVGTRARSHALHVGIALILAGGIEESLRPDTLRSSPRFSAHASAMGSSVLDELAKWKLRGVSPGSSMSPTCCSCWAWRIIVFKTGARKEPGTGDDSPLQKGDGVIDPENQIGG